MSVPISGSLAPPEGGELLASISRRIVQLLARHAGKGPTRCKTHWAGSDVLVVVLGGGYTEAERTLYERGRADDVRAYRTAIQDALSEDMSREVEALTGRKVVAFMSTSHQEPDLLVEIFVLEQPSVDGHGPSSDGHGPSSDGHGPSSDGHGPSSDGHGPSSDGHRPMPAPEPPAAA